MQQGEVDNVHAKLERPNWALWLEASPTTMKGRVEVFPEGQMLAKSMTGELIASLSMNQIDWDGDPNSLPTWDEVAGSTFDYAHTYHPKGNTLVLMSMNVAQAHQGEQIPGKMIAQAKVLAAKLGIKHLIGSFRPSGYGKAKLEWIKQGKSIIPFWDYCMQTRPFSLKPVDPWLGSLYHSDMKMIKDDAHAMYVPVTIAEFEQFKAEYHPESWVQGRDRFEWECGEVGTWHVHEPDNQAVYEEHNVYGEIPL